MGIELPDRFRLKIEGPIGPVAIDGIPDDFSLSVDALPKIMVGVDPLSVGVTELSKVNVGVDPLRLTLDPITVKPLDLALSISRIPDVRAHLPADFSLRLRVFGVEVFCIRLSGEAQVITEPYLPNPCESGGSPPSGPSLVPLPVESG